MPTATAAQLLSAVGFLLSYKYETDTHSRCVMLCIIEATEYFRCVIAMMFAALAHVQMCRGYSCLFALLVKESLLTI